MEPMLNTKKIRYFRTTSIVLLSTPAFLWLVTRRVSVEWTRTGQSVYETLQTKTLWDWMDLLLIPLFLAGGALLLARSRRNTEHQRAAVDAALEREIAKDRQQEEAYQVYLDRMTDLLLKDKLSKFSPEEVRNVARIRTLVVLRELDSRRKGSVALFLKDAGLIDREAVIDLSRADLRQSFLAFANLSRVNISEADLSGADMRRANLSKSYLSGANLSEADLSGANLGGTDLFESNLSGANLTQARLSEANLNGADLRGCRLNEADLCGADLSGVNLNVGDLVGASLRGAKLGGAKLLGADLRQADLSRADLSGTEITSTELEKVKSLEGAIMPDGTKHD